MLAQKQPCIQRVRNSSLVEWLCAENLTGLNYTPKLGVSEARNKMQEARIGQGGKRQVMIQHYKDLTVYQKSYQAALDVYRIAKQFPREEIYGIMSQIKRAATSIPLNIAEGYGKRQSASEFKRFLMMAIGSSDEVRVLLDFSKDLGYVAQEVHATVYAAYEEIGKMLNGLHSNWK